MKAVEVRNIKIGEGIPKICVPIVGVTKEDIINEAKTFENIPVDVVEWRVDWFENVFDIEKVKDVLTDLRQVLKDTPILFTFRTSKEGGEKAIEAADYAKLNKEIAATGNVDLVDVEAFTGDEVVKEVISNIRSIRLQKNIAQKEPLELQVVGENPVAAFDAVIIKMCNLSAVTAVEAKADGAAAFMVGTTEFAVPLGNMIDVEAEIARMEAELKHKEGFLQGVLKKLGNEKFVNNSPAAVIEMERKKQEDAESIISSLRESIAALKKA